MSERNSSHTQSAPCTAYSHTLARPLSASLLCRALMLCAQMQRDAVSIARDAFSECKGVQKDVAASIKKRFDERYPGSTWHCIVGSHFASSIQAATRSLTFFSISGQNVLLYRSLE